MRPGRAFSLLAGVALLGGIAQFNEMTPDAQASLLGAAAETARTTTQSLLSRAVATYNEMTGANAAAQQPPAPVSPAPRAGEGNAGAPTRQIAARTADAEAPSGNPLWVLPLKQLTTTRERPIFSPSRRPPPTPTFVAPVAVRTPVKPPEPERPAVSLLGTIIGTADDDRIGVFLETSTQNIVRLRVGEDHQGWVLRLVKAREATLVKNGEQAVVLELPPPGDMMPGQIGYTNMPSLAPGGFPGGLPGVAPGTLPVPAATAPPRQRRQR
jgi:hypothetical protein